MRPGFRHDREIGFKYNLMMNLNIIIKYLILTESLKQINLMSFSRS